MRIGYIGLGKLGSVCAAVLAKHGHEVLGFDPFSDGKIPSYEVGTDALEPVQQAASVVSLVDWAQVIFLAVQTPHAPEYGGENPTPEIGRDFEYSYLVQACRDVFHAAEGLEKPTTLVIVSTVLPGTVNRLIRPMKPSYVDVIYNPFTIAMGTTVDDFENPEFVIVGADDEGQVAILKRIYSLVHDRPLFITSIETAELIKVAYNTFISMKTVWANAMMELCHKTGADCDVLVDALSLATERVISPRYMRGGVGDAGHCHPRDNTAMSHLAKKLDLSVDLMGFLASARDTQSEWLVDLACQWQDQISRDIVLLGVAYKPNISLTGGSIALLMQSQLKAKARYVTLIDPHIEEYNTSIPDHPAVYVVVTKHDVFLNWRFAPGSVVIDPHGVIKDQPGVVVVRVGRK